MVWNGGDGINKLIARQVSFLSKNANIYDEYQIDRLRYGLECLYSEGSKLLVLFCVSLVLNTTDYVLIMLLLLVPRSLLGGSHLKTYLSCFLATLLLFLIIPIISNIILLISIPYQILIFTFLYIASFLKRDKQLLTRPKRTKKFRLIQKILGLTFMLLTLVVSNILLNDNLINFAVITSILILSDYILGGNNYEN